MKRPRQLLLSACLLGILAASGYGVWFWKQYTRPGMTHYLRGLDYLAARQYGQAKAEWLQGTREDPDSPQCYVPLGDFYAQAQRYGDAAKCYAAAAKLMPQDGSVFLKLAQAEQHQEHWTEARSAVNRAAQLRPGDAEAAELSGILAADQKDYPAALAALRRAHALRPTDRAFLMKLAVVEINRFDTPAAERDLAPYLQAHPQDAEACYLMTLVYQHKPRTPANLQAAVDMAQRAHIAGPGDASLDLLLGQILLDASRPAEALQAFQAAETDHSLTQKALVGEEAADARLGRTTQAAAIAARIQAAATRQERIKQLSAILREHPADIAAGLELTRLEEDGSNAQAAQANYVILLRQAPHDPGAHAALADFFRRTGRADLARQALRPDYVP
ncbi:MAG: tetratricopeptide repeat protein [Armatimonadota bacterium]|nr:tetratricopeptide repeat protein [Armatimonadota bacterium]